MNKFSTTAAMVSMVGLGVLGSDDVSAKSSSWEKDGTQDGVTVFTRPVRGSGVPMVMGVTTVDANPAQVWQLVDNGGIKLRGLKERRTIERCGGKCEYVYVRLGNWLISDRHYVLKMTSSVEQTDLGTSYAKTWTKARDRKPPSDASAVEVMQISGKWILDPLDGGKKTRLTYINHLDLGGSVPTVLFAPKFVAKSYDILKKVRQDV